MDTAMVAEVAMAALVGAMVAVVGAGVARGGGPAGRVVGAIGLWLAFAAILAASGALAVWTARPPRVLLLPLTVLATSVLLNRTATMRQLLARTPLAWPLAAQSFRVGVELVLYGLHAAGRAPVQVTFEGRNLDILVGLTAPVLAWLVRRERVPAWAVVLWNGVSLLVLANTVGVVASSFPGPTHLDWPGEPFTALATWPMVWLPAFLVPLAVSLHVFSLRQQVAQLGRVPAVA